MNPILEVSHIENFKIYKFKKSTDSIVIKPRVRHLLLVDNSASMGQNTKNCVNIIGSGFFNLNHYKNKIILEDGIVMTFSQRTQILSSTIKSTKDFNTLIFPNQNNTNITGAIKDAINFLLT